MTPPLWGPPGGPSGPKMAQKMKIFKKKIKNFFFIFFSNRVILSPKNEKKNSSTIRLIILDLVFFSEFSIFSNFSNFSDFLDIRHGVSLDQYEQPYNGHF